MASNSFGRIFRITTFGESHGPAIGVVIDGCPAGLPLQKEEIDQQLFARRPGRTPYTSPREELDTVELLSGVFEGKTTGAPIAILIRNRDADSSQYEAIKDIYRPGHANFTYLEKYGCFDHRGAGRASARETAARVAAGAVAKKLLDREGITCVAYLAAVGGISMAMEKGRNLAELRKNTSESPIFCPEKGAAMQMIDALETIKIANDSLGGVVACEVHLPAGLGDPVYGKLEAELAYAMLSLPATKGFEIGSGFTAAEMKGSEHNDEFDIDEAGNIHTRSNFSGGTLGGISTGSPLYFRVAFKPTSSIKRAQASVRLSGEKTTFELPKTARHDPCVAIRAVPVVEAMTALVLADALLMNRSSKC